MIPRSVLKSKNLNNLIGPGEYIDLNKTSSLDKKGTSFGKNSRWINKPNTTAVGPGEINLRSTFS